MNPPTPTTTPIMILLVWESVEALVVVAGANEGAAVGAITGACVVADTDAAETVGFDAVTEEKTLGAVDPAASVTDKNWVVKAVAKGLVPPLAVVAVARAVDAAVEAVLAAAFDTVSVTV